MKITRIDYKESMMTTMILEFEHFEEEYSVEAIGENLVEILGFKPVVAFSRG